MNVDLMKDVDVRVVLGDETDSVEATIPFWNLFIPQRLERLRWKLVKVFAREEDKKRLVASTGRDLRIRDLEVIVDGHSLKPSPDMLGYLKSLPITTRIVHPHGQMIMSTSRTFSPVLVAAIHTLYRSRRFSHRLRELVPAAMDKRANLINLDNYVRSLRYIGPDMAMLHLGLSDILSSNPVPRGLPRAVLITAMLAREFRKHGRNVVLQRLLSYSPPDTLKPIRSALLAGEVPQLGDLLRSLLSLKLDKRPLSMHRSASFLWKPGTDSLIPNRRHNPQDGHLLVRVALPNEKMLGTPFWGFYGSWYNIGIHRAAVVSISDGYTYVCFEFSPSLHRGCEFPQAVRIVSLPGPDEPPDVLEGEIDLDETGACFHIYKYNKINKRTYNSLRRTMLYANSDPIIRKSREALHTVPVDNSNVGRILPKVLRLPSLRGEVRKYVSLLPIRTHDTCIYTPEDLAVAIIFAGHNNLQFGGAATMVRRLITSGARTLSNVIANSLALRFITLMLCTSILPQAEASSEDDGSGIKRVWRYVNQLIDRKESARLTATLLGSQAKLDVLRTLLHSLFGDGLSDYKLLTSNLVQNLASQYDDRFNIIGKLISSSAISLIVQASTMATEISGDEEDVSSGKSDV